MRILFGTAECSPFVRTGGLGDAVAGLALALGRLGHHVTVAVPGYDDLADVESATESGSWGFVEPRDDVGFRLALFRDPLFERPGIYGPRPGEGYEDNWLRFGRFAAGVAVLARDFDVLHVQDAHPGPAALLSATPSVYTVHNAAHPVLGPLTAAAGVLGVSSDASAPEGALEWYGQANYLKAGLVGAAQATTVSPTHAKELAVEETSFGLGGIIRHLEPPMVGVLNGIDTASWDPSTDPALAAPFDLDDLAGRDACRRALLAETGLTDGFVVGNVGRMAVQKGFRLLEPQLADLIDEGMRMVLVGNGELDGLVDSWVADYPEAVVHVPFDEAVARRVFAGVDAYLMPSQFEPCGLGQMYAMRYGAPPIARFTGGLADTVVDIDEHPKRGNGFGFRSFLPESLAKTIRRAMQRSDTDDWAILRRNGMGRDWSWDARAFEYAKVYSSVL